MERDRERETEDEEASAPEGGAVREKLKLVAHYALLAFAPVVAIVALIVALVATGNRSDQAQLGEANARIDKLEASLQASRAEVENLKFAMSREKSLHGDERKKEDELNEIVVQNVSRLQVKLKVVPTLEEQLRVETRAPGAASHVESATPVTGAAVVPAAPDKIQAASAPLSTSADKKPASTAPQTEGKKQAPAAPAKNVEQKKKPSPASTPKATETTSPQVKALKDAINQYNKQ